MFVIFMNVCIHMQSLPSYIHTFPFLASRAPLQNSQKCRFQRKEGYLSDHILFWKSGRLKWKLNQISPPIPHWKLPLLHFDRKQNVFAVEKIVPFPISRTGEEKLPWNYSPPLPAHSFLLLAVSPLCFSLPLWCLAVTQASSFPVRGVWMLFVMEVLIPFTKSWSSWESLHSDLHLTLPKYVHNTQRLYFFFLPEKEKNYSQRNAISSLERYRSHFLFRGGSPWPVIPFFFFNNFY